MSDPADQLARLLATARRVAESLELDTVLGSIVHDATTLLGADSGDMLLWDRDSGRLRVVAVWNFPPEMLGFEMAFGEGVSSQAIETRQPIEIADYGTYEHRAEGLERYHFGAVLCAPLVFRGEAIGAINVHARTGGHRFDPGAAVLLAALAGHAAIAIDHARRFENEVRLGRDLAESNRELTRSLAVQQQLAEQVLLDTGPAGIAGVLAEHLDRQVVIEDHLHRLIAGAAPGGGEDWRGLVDPDPAKDGGPARTPFAVEVRIGPEIVGHLVLSSDEELGPIDRALVDVATTGVALEFAKIRAAAEIETRVRGEAATDLLTGSYATEAAISARAARSGYDLGRLRDVFVVGIDRAEDHASSMSEDELQRRTLDVVLERTSGRDRRGLAVWHAGLLVVLATPEPDRARSARDLAVDLKAAIESLPEVATATIAIGDRCTRPNDYGPAFRASRDAVELMVRLGRPGAVVETDDLGPYGLLLRASSRSDLEAFAQRTLGPLFEHDRRHDGELVATLRTYLETGGVQRQVAARRFIHVNTVVYRLRRIRELLDRDIADPAAVFDLTLALRVVDLIGLGGQIPADADAAAVPGPARLRV